MVIWNAVQGRSESVMCPWWSYLLFGTLLALLLMCRFCWGVPCAAFSLRLISLRYSSILSLFLFFLQCRTSILFHRIAVYRLVVISFRYSSLHSSWALRFFSYRCTGSFMATTAVGRSKRCDWLLANSSVWQLQWWGGPCLCFALCLSFCMSCLCLHVVRRLVQFNSWLAVGLLIIS